MYNIRESASRLKKLRQKTNKTQSQVADDLGISVDTVRKNEQGVRGLSVDLADIYAEYYGVSIDYIINGRDSSNFELSRMIEKYPNVPEEMVRKILTGILESLSQ